MILPDQIIKSNRKTLSLTIKNNGEIIIHAPQKIQDAHINKFLEQKQDWILSKLSAIKTNQNKFSEVITFNRFLLFGQEYAVIIGDVKRVEVRQNNLVISKKIEQDKIVSAITSFYKKKAKEILQKRLYYWQDRLKIKCNNFRITNSKGKWGSCNSNSVITINWRAIMVLPACIDYIIVHELCHLIEMNHSKRFWTLVETFLPSYNTLRHDLKEYAFLLELYR